jgi:shikimate dehydrogenase
MYAAAFAALGIEGWRYQRLPVPPGLFAETVRALGPAGFVGANVTIPHKEAALALATDASEPARRIGAANTLSFQPDGAIEADNTDAPGLLAALPFSPAGRSALVLGAGGSARAVVWALVEEGARDIAVWNRTPERARILAGELRARAVADAVPADLLVNCTPVGRGDPGPAFKELGLDADQLAGYACVVDLVYRTGETALVAAARERGIQTVDGLEFLVRQGALSFERWTGRPGPIEAMRTGARGG